jgi:transcription termination factor Rho
MARPAGRNEKNPALLRIDTVNDMDPEKARERPKFEDLTPLFPDEKLRLEGGDPNNMTARIVDLISPIGKGQRGLIVSPPKAGKTTIMKTIATSIERNNPEVKLMVLLVDERPEEVTDMRRTVQGEVIAPTFDRPSDEHARSRDGHRAGQADGGDGRGRRGHPRRHHPPVPGLQPGRPGHRPHHVRWHRRRRPVPAEEGSGAARNIEEGGSLTVLASALVETNSRMDDAIFEEFEAPATWSCASTASWPSAGCTRPSTWIPRPPATRSCCSIASSSRWCGSCGGCCRGWPRVARRRLV